MEISSFDIKRKKKLISYSKCGHNVCYPNMRMIEFYRVADKNEILVFKVFPVLYDHSVLIETPYTNIHFTFSFTIRMQMGY